jgi:hypothetical protein
MGHPQLWELQAEKQKQKRQQIPFGNDRQKSKSNNEGNSSPGYWGLCMDQEPQKDSNQRLM